MPRPPHSSWFDHPNNILWREQVLHFPVISSQLGSNIFFSTQFPNTLSLTSSPRNSQVRKPSVMVEVGLILNPNRTSLRLNPSFRGVLPATDHRTHCTANLSFSWSRGNPSPTHCFSVIHVVREHCAASFLLCLILYSNNTKFISRA
jgi:hypothetical protein